jgi:hypothetical protein
MPETRHVSRSDGAFVIVGTTKGLFVFACAPEGDSWEVGGPYLPGEEVYAASLDTRAGRRRLWAAGTSSHWGPGLLASDDLGRTFAIPEQAPIRFPERTDVALKRVWQIAAPADSPETLYAGVEPAALFVSRDAGATWSLNDGLYDHPHRPKWQPGGGGLCLHTILVAGRRLVCAISSAGIYRSDDGGETWQARNVGVRARFMPPENQFPEFGHCPHKLAAHPARPDTLYLQHHGGVYRSDDFGDTWQAVGGDLPSDFGFPIAVHPDDGDTIYVLPLEADVFRAPPNARLRVYRSRDGGRTFSPLAHGLPEENAYDPVLRDGMCAGRAGVFFGTRGGRLFGSRDFGDTWTQMAGSLPSIVSVKTSWL